MAPKPNNTPTVRLLPNIPDPAYRARAWSGLPQTLNDFSADFQAWKMTSPKPNAPKNRNFQPCFCKKAKIQTFLKKCLKNPVRRAWKNPTSGKPGSGPTLLTENRQSRHPRLLPIFELAIKNPQKSRFLKNQNYLWIFLKNPEKSKNFKIL